ncbi:hypothetical protein QTO34_014234 [Cnephaeus nilssonii]|uniref:Uncharacterized protein n=1 Tax=Cnephaeus nilssonii TaxID=3371016 RepID=A0AA40LRP8_CNENI|nr:hypothetical protein QTO34_014234 [Eptesicus nilssonii]
MERSDFAWDKGLELRLLGGGCAGFHLTPMTSLPLPTVSSSRLPMDVTSIKPVWPSQEVDSPPSTLLKNYQNVPRTEKVCDVLPGGLNCCLDCQDLKLRRTHAETLKGQSSQALSADEH